MSYRSFAIAFGVVAMWIAPSWGRAEDVVSAEQAAERVSLRNITVRNGVISGEVVNTSLWPLRGVELLVQHRWQWKNEFRPGENNPGTAAYYRVEREIPPGSSVLFTYEQPILPTRPDGQFETVVSVAEFAQVVTQ